MNIVAFIPARGGSKIIPNKNLKLLGDRPLVAWSIESAQKCNLRTIVNTDSEEIAKIAKEYGAEIQMRPASLGKDSTSMFELLRSEIPKLDVDFVLLLQPTSPFRKSIHIKSAISYFNQNLDEYDSLVSVEKVPNKYNPYAMIIENSGKKMFFRKLIGLKEKLISLFTGKKFKGPMRSGYPINQRMTRRQDLPQAWLPTGEIYIFKVENLKNGDLYGKKTILLECEGSLNLNTLEDFEKAEQICAQKS